MSCLLKTFPCVIVAVLYLLAVPTVRAGEFEMEFRRDVGAFVSSLNEAQSKQCLLDVDDKRRWRMHYPGGKRPGIQIGQLNAAQRASLEKVIRMVLSDYGWTMANKVAAQDAKDGKDGLRKYFVTCFGDPRKEGSFALRVAEHHLTIVHLEVEKGNTKEFGPILLGANPANLWQGDEKILLDVWTKMADSKVLIKDKKAIASEPMKEGEGVVFGDLKTEAQIALRAAWDLRLSIFTKPIQERINNLHKARGGWQKSRVSFYGEIPKKHCIDGGRWDFKCGLPGMVWDLQTSGGHIHMSMWAK